MNLVKNQISELVQSVMDGNSSACEAYALLKDLKPLIESGLKVIEDGAMIEAREFDKGEKYFGGVWEFRSTATYLDFSKDEVYTNLNQSALSRKKELNEAFKASQTGKGFFDSETGEEVPILPVKTPAKEILIYKQKQ